MYWQWKGLVGVGVGVGVGEGYIIFGYCGATRLWDGKLI